MANRDKGRKKWGGFSQGIPINIFLSRSREETVNGIRDIVDTLARLISMRMQRYVSPLDRIAAPS